MHTIFFIDTSGSIVPSMLEGAKQFVREYADEQFATDVITVVPITEIVETIYCVENAQDSTALDAILECVQQYGGGSISRTVMTEVLEKGERERPVDKVYFLSDGVHDTEDGFDLRHQATLREA